MATNQNIIDKALYNLGYIEYGANADATDAADALDDLNIMMAQFEQQDMDLNWFPQDTLSATCPIPRWAERGIAANLALELAATFNVAPTPSLVKKADEGMEAILNTLINNKLTGLDMSHLPQGDNYRYDIDTDNS